MDNEFVEKLESISIHKKLSENELESRLSITFNTEIDGLIKITAEKGEFTYLLKPLEGLYAKQESRKSAENEMMSLLYQIERAIKGYDMADYGLTDSSVIIALEKLSMKPEAPVQDDLLRSITGYLRMFLSIHDYSRSELRQAINRVLRSARRHNKIDGTRGYLDFIRENVP